MNSSNIQENDENNSFPNFSPATEPSSKKRKFSMGGSSSSSISGLQFTFLQSENENLKKLVKGLEEHILENDGNGKELMELEESTKALEAANTDLQIKLEEQQNQHKTEMDLLQSTSNNYLEKIKVLENKNKQIEETLQKLNEEICIMKTIKSEIKDETENERESFKTEKDNLNAEIQQLQKKNSELEQKYHDTVKVKEELKEEKEEVEQRIGKLEDEIRSAKDSLQIDGVKFMEEKRSFQATIKIIRAEKNYLKKTNFEFIQKYNDCEKGKEEVEKRVKNLEDEIQAAKDSMKADAEKFMEEKASLQAEIKKVRAERDDLKKTNISLEKAADEDKNIINEWEAKYKKVESDFTNSILEKQHLQKKYDHVFKEKDQNLKNINKTKEEVEQLSKKNLDLMNDNETLQDSVEEQKELIESLKNKDSKHQHLNLHQVSSDHDLDVSLLCCKPKKVLRISKIKGRKDGIDFYSTTDDTEEPFNIESTDFSKTYFEMRICDEFVIESGCKQLNEIISRIYSCYLRKIHLCKQEITFADFVQLVKYADIQICFLEHVKLIDDSKECEMYKILQQLPDIEQFKYEFCNDVKGPAMKSVAGNLSKKLESFPSLEKFQLLNIPYSFKLEDFSGFINKNNEPCYILKFSNLPHKYMQTAVDTGKKKMLNSFNVNYNIAIEYRKDLL